VVRLSVLFTFYALRFGAFFNSLSISAAEGILGVLMLAAIYRLHTIRDYSVFKKSFFVFFILMIIAETISTFTGVDPDNSIKSLKSFWPLFYLPVIYVLFEGRNKMGYLNYSFVGGITAAVYGIYEIVSGKVQRADGFFSHALTYGNIMAILCITALGVLVFRLYRRKSQLYLTIAALVLCGAALMLSGSRGPILSFMIVAVVMFVYGFGWRGFAVCAVFLAICTGVVAGVPAVKMRFAETISSLDDSTTSMGTRLVLWEASSNAIMARPIFGYGKRNFKNEVSKYIDVPTSSRAHAHNTYIQYTFLHGFFGLVALLGYLGSIIWETKRRIRSGPFVKLAMFILAVFLLEGLTENTLGDSEVVMSCFSLVGLMLAPGRAAISQDKEYVEVTES
jgi:O-antigen ligase